MLKFRRPVLSDLEIYFNWANDELVRSQSFNSAPISKKEHELWFNEKLNDTKCAMYLFQDHLNNYIGQVRMQAVDSGEVIIGISIDANARGKGYGTQMLIQATEDYHLKNPDLGIHAYVKMENKVSVNIFEKSGFILKNIIDYKRCSSYHFIKYANRTSQY